MTTMNLVVSASADDAQQRQDGSNYSHTGTTITLRADTNPNLAYVLGARFTGAGDLAGMGIDSAVPWLNVWLLSADDFLVDIHAEAADDAPTFSAGNPPLNRTKTSESIEWVEDSAGTGYQRPADNASAVIQEVTDRAGFAGSLVLLYTARTTAIKQAIIRTYNAGSSLAPKLDVDYSEPQPPFPVVSPSKGGAALMAQPMSVDRRMTEDDDLVMVMAALMETGP